MVTTWYYLVMLKKGLSQDVIDRYKNLYEDNFSIVIVNGSQGRCVQNILQSIRQGDKFAMELFSFGIDPMLGYLARRLLGIPGCTRPSPSPCSTSSSPSLPSCSSHTSSPPASTRYTRFPSSSPTSQSHSFQSQQKKSPGTSSPQNQVHPVRLLRQPATTKMHRTADSQMGKFLALGKWKTTLTQAMTRHNFFTLSDHLDFLAVVLKSTFTATRKTNGEILQS